MTLILTWLFPEGIVMGADSAVTQTVPSPSGRGKRRILTGYRKVYKIQKINAGISCWGTGKVGEFRTDIWLPDFISSRESEYDSLHSLAILLQDELRDLVPEITASKETVEYRYGNRGFHLAGYTEHKGSQVPTFYHIHNGQSEIYPKINPRIMNANHDLPPQEVLDLFTKNIAPHVRNGDFIFYSFLFNTLSELFNTFYQRVRIGDTPFVFPNIPRFEEPLEGYSEFVRFWIRLVRDVYALNNVPEVIGGNISILSIAPDGVMKLANKP